MKQFKLLKLMILTALVLAAWCCTGNTDAYAAGTSTGGKYPYTIQKYTQILGEGQSVTGKYEYQLPRLKGKTKAIKKINKALKKGYKESLTDKKNLAGYVNEANKNPNTAYRGACFVSTTTCKATYNKNGYISFRFHHDWFAGGVHNGWTDGMTFYVKTGKKLNVSNVISGNAKTVKQKIINKYFQQCPAQDNSTARGTLNNTKISQFQFYLKNGKVIVGFGPYQPGFGNGESKIVFKGNY